MFKDRISLLLPAWLFRFLCNLRFQSDVDDTVRKKPLLFATFQRRRRSLSLIHTHTHTEKRERERERKREEKLNEFETFEGVDNLQFEHVWCWQRIDKSTNLWSSLRNGCFVKPETLFTACVWFLQIRDILSFLSWHFKIRNLFLPWIYLAFQERFQLKKMLLCSLVHLLCPHTQPDGNAETQNTQFVRCE